MTIQAIFTYKVIQFFSSPAPFCRHLYVEIADILSALLEVVVESVPYISFDAVVTVAFGTVGVEFPLGSADPGLRRKVSMTEI